MCGNLAAQQNLANRLATVLRTFEREGGSIEQLADAVGETPRDLRRWAEGTKLPGHVLVALLGELPEHLASKLISASGRKLVSRDYEDASNALLAASRLSALSSDIAERHADGVFCHRDRAAVSDHASALIPQLQALVVEADQ